MGHFPNRGYTCLGKELRQERLVRGDHVLALFEGFEDHVLRMCNATHELHHAVDALVFQDI